MDNCVLNEDREFHPMISVFEAATALPCLLHAVMSVMASIPQQLRFRAQIGRASWIQAKILTLS